MNLPELKHGDIFVVYGTSLISKLIKWYEKLTSQDNKAKASHAGIILNPSGVTFEAQADGIKRDLIQHYKGQHIVIFRHKEMNIERFWHGFDAIKKYEKNIYPYWRLLVHSIPVISKLNLLGIPVCSELVTEFLYKSFCNHKEVNDLMMRFQNYWGWTPDELEDDLRIAKDFDIIFNGKF